MGVAGGEYARVLLASAPLLIFVGVKSDAALLEHGFGK